MRKACGTIGVVLAVLAALPQPARGATVPFTPGEELVYEVEALGMNAGKARISVGAAADRDGSSAWPIVVWARTDSLFDAVYPVRDRFVSWWEPDSGRALGADLFADEGGKKRRESSRVDHALGKAEVRREKGSERSTSSYPVPAGVFDIAGALMALRGEDLAVGQVVQLPVFTGKKVFTLRCTIVGTEKIETDAGSFDTLVARVQLGFDGKFAAKRDLKVWFSADEQKIPVRLEVEFVLGHLVAQLVQYHRGVTHPAAIARPAGGPADGAALASP
jgi:hypothetical protein